MSKNIDGKLAGVNKAKVVSIIFCYLVLILGLLLSGIGVAFSKRSDLGVREGTIISAVVLGFVVKFITRLIRKPIEKLFDTEHILGGNK